MSLEAGPLRVLETRVRRFYRGGAQLEARAGRAPIDDDRPEDWIGSVTQAAGEEPGVGLSRVELPDGGVAVLRDLVATHPKQLLGALAIDATGAEPGILVKILDPDERLPVHAHPSRSFAARTWGATAGKAEAWIVLGVRGDIAEPCVHLGLREGIDPSDFAEWMRAQDTVRLLDALHRLPVAVGDVVYVPPGMPHAIGAGVLVIEVQEATDFSYLCEYAGFPIAKHNAHLGLDATAGLELLDLRPRSIEALRDECVIVPDGARVLHGGCEQFFSAEQVGEDDQPGGRFCVAVATAGGWIDAGGQRQSVTAGEGFVLPANLPSWRYGGGARGIAFYGPADLPNSADGAHDTTSNG